MRSRPAGSRRGAPDEVDSETAQKYATLPVMRPIPGPGMKRVTLTFEGFPGVGGTIGLVIAPDGKLQRDAGHVERVDRVGLAALRIALASIGR